LLEELLNEIEKLWLLGVDYYAFWVSSFNKIFP
jgi:hypothetical protein